MFKSTIYNSNRLEVTVGFIRLAINLNAALYDYHRAIWFLLAAEVRVASGLDVRSRERMQC